MVQALIGTITEDLFFLWITYQIGHVGQFNMLLLNCAFVHFRCKIKMDYFPSMKLVKVVKKKVCSDVTWSVHLMYVVVLDLALSTHFLNDNIKLHVYMCYFFIKYDVQVCIERDQVNTSKWYYDNTELLLEKKNKYDNSYAERMTYLWNKYIVMHMKTLQIICQSLYICLDHMNWWSKRRNGFLHMLKKLLHAVMISW